MSDKLEWIKVRHEEECFDSAVEDREWLLAEVERQARHIEELQSKIAAAKSCACSYDAPGDVCAAHSPALAEARAEVERLRDKTERLQSNNDNLTLERDETRAEVERLREALHRVSLASQNSMSSKDECGRIAREALEAKP